MSTTPLTTDADHGVRLSNRTSTNAHRKGSETDSRAAAEPHDARTRAALKRLGEFLASGEPPRPDAPRGTYLNITL